MSGTAASASNSPSASSPAPDITNEEVKAFFNSMSSASSSESDVDLCGPHDDCCGGTVRNGVFTQCAKRLGKPGMQHRRGEVCRSLHPFFQCATCQNVVHSGCWVRTAKGSFVLPSTSVPFHCYPCDLIKGLPFDPTTVVAKVKEKGLGQTHCSSDLQESTVEEAALCQPQTSENKRVFMSETELRKYCKERDWLCWNSTQTRIYYRCKYSNKGGCDVRFKAKKCNEDDTWFIDNMPTSHSCCSAPPQILTSLVTLKDNLSAELVKEIERLGVSKSFRSKQIQNHLLHEQKVLVDTKLIRNIVYRVRQKLFGHQGDMIHLLEQQKVA
jgi:hypothetical protein